MSDPVRLPELGHRERRRALVRALIRSLVVVALLSIAYFVLPLDRLSETAAVVSIIGGASFVVALCAWQVRQIVRAPVPAVRSAEALAVTLPVYLLGSATTVFLLSATDPGAFNESLTRIDALYFTLTVFATVGFGDIAAVEQSARAAVSVMIIGNLVMLAVGVKLLTGAAKWGISSRSDQGAGDESP